MLDVAVNVTTADVDLAVNSAVVDVAVQGMGATGPAGADGQGVPAGGTTGQVLAKASNADFDSDWNTITGTGIVVSVVGGTGITVNSTDPANPIVTSTEPALATHIADTVDAHDASAISTTPTSGTETDVEAVLDVLTTEINVLAYGARGDYNGAVSPSSGSNPTILAANDAAFTLAWADAKAQRATLYIPSGNYGLSPNIVATTTDDAGIRVEDIATTIIWCVDTTNTGTFFSQSITDTTFWSNATRKRLPRFDGPTLDGTWAGTGSVAVRIGPAHSGYYQFAIRNFAGTGGANGVTGETGAIGFLAQNDPAHPTQFTESCVLGPRFSVQNCTNAFIVDKNGGNKSFGYMRLQYFHFRNNTNGITVTNGAWLYACDALLQGVTTTAITSSAIVLSGSDSRFTGQIDFNYEINSASATVTLITTAAGTIWKTTGHIDALTGAYALPANSISSTSVFHHEGPFYDSPLPASQDGWLADATFDGGIAGDELLRTGGASGVASTFTKFGDFRNRYKVGVPVLWTESGTVKYGVVSIDSTFSAGRTTVTLYASTLYWMAATPDTGSLCYSFGFPPDLPATFRMVSLGLDPDLLTASIPASTTISSFVAGALDETTVGAFLTALGIDADVATLAVPASTTISSFVAGALDETTIAAFLTALGLDADIATLAVPASTTITSFAATLLDDTTQAAAQTTLGLGTGDSPTFAGLTLSGATNGAQGATIASAATTDIGAATGDYVAISGTTTITSLGTAAAGVTRLVQFNGALTLTHNATSLILPGSANITTAGGDFATFVSTGSGNWRCATYQRKAVPPLSVSVEEGTFIPTFTGATTSGTTQTYSQQVGQYKRIGNVVNIQLRMTMTSIGDCVGNLRIDGLPYASKNTAGGEFIFDAQVESFSTAIAFINARNTHNTTYLELYYRTAAATSSTICTVGAAGASCIIMITGTYFV